MQKRTMVGLTAGLMLAVVGEVGAQSLGTFTWQQQPYCNLITVNVVQQGSGAVGGGAVGGGGSAMRVNALGDRFEQEADSVAKTVTNASSTPSVQRAPP